MFRKVEMGVMRWDGDWYPLRQWQNNDFSSFKTRQRQTI